VSYEAIDAKAQAVVDAAGSILAAGGWQHSHLTASGQPNSPRSKEVIARSGDIAQDVVRCTKAARRFTGS
jgi:hypothetical protein